MKKSKAKTTVDKTEEELAADMKREMDEYAARQKKIDDRERQEYERIRAKLGNGPLRG